LKDWSRIRIRSWIRIREAEKITDPDLAQKNKHIILYIIISKVRKILLLVLEAVFRIRIRMRIHRIHVFLGLPDPDPLVRGMDPDPDPAPDPDPSVMKQI
jgi:hypothetical protein